MALVAAGKEEGWDKNWKSPVKGELKSRDELPGTVSSFLPLIFLVAFIVIGSLTKFISNATLLSCLGMAFAFIICLVLNRKYLGNSLAAMFKSLFADSAGAAATSALVLGAVVRFRKHRCISTCLPEHSDMADWIGYSYLLERRYFNQCPGRCYSLCFIRSAVMYAISG